MDDLEYENIVAAIAFIDAAIRELDEFEQKNVSAKLNDIRNSLNVDRLARLPNGVYNVDRALSPT